MELTILGANGTYPTADGACSGYLLEHEGFTVWMDTGNGTMSKLQQNIDPSAVDAVFLSHSHSDHVVDLYPYFFWLLFNGDRTIPVFAPRGTRAKMETFVGDTRAKFNETLQWNELEPGDMVDLGPFHLATFESTHSQTNLVSRWEAGDKVLCYSGDTGPDPHLAKAARDANLFVCEASWLACDVGLMDPIHMQATEAGAAASDAGVDRLMLTHIWPRNDLDQVLGEASSTFNGAIELALHTYRTAL